MSDLGFMERLLDGATVEWNALADIFYMKNGYTPSRSKKEFWENGTVPWFRMDDIRANGQVLDQSLLKVSESAVKGGKLFPANSMIFATSATIGEHALIKVPYLANQRFTNLTLKDEFAHRFINKFLFYYGFKLAAWCQRNTTKSSFASVDMDGFRKFQVPIPCPDNPEKSLAIQAEIVRVLDAFTELTAELTARRKQYKHYRELLLNFETSVRWMTLGDIGSFTYGYVAKAKERGDVRFVRITDIDTTGRIIPDNPKYVDLNAENEKFLLAKGDLLMARTGATFGKTMIFNEDYPAIYAGFLIKLSLDSRTVDPKYYWHFSQSSLFWDQANMLVSGGGQPQFNANALKQITLPIPYPDSPEKSLAEQARIVAILDKFDTLTTSISEGLPREIKLRQQQYEYYRDLLLSFPKPEEAA